MYIVQNLGTRLFGVFNIRNAGVKCMWHSRREFATRFETKDEIEEKIEAANLERDKLRVINDKS